MAEKMVIRMKSGRQYEQELDEEGHSFTAEEACEKFFEAVSLAKFNTLRFGPAIVVVAEIEAIYFE